MSPSLGGPGERPAELETRLALGLFRLEQALAGLRGAAAQDAGLSPLQLAVLLDLVRGGVSEPTAAALARRYGLTPATLSDSIGVLVRRRLLSRRADPTDGRRRMLRATAKGAALAREAEERLDALARLVGEMPRAAREQALGSVIEIVARLAAAGWIAPERMCVTCRFFERERSPGAAAPHFCHLIERALGPGDLRVDCAEHEPAPAPS